MFRYDPMTEYITEVVVFAVDPLYRVICAELPVTEDTVTCCVSAQPVSGVAMTTGFALNPLYDIVAVAFFFADALMLTRPVLTTTILLFNELSICFSNHL